MKPKTKARPKNEYEPAALLNLLDNMFDEAQQQEEEQGQREDLLDDETRAAAALLESEFSFDNIMAEVLEETKKKEALAAGAVGRKGEEAGDDDDRLTLDSNLQFDDVPLEELDLSSAISDDEEFALGKKAGTSGVPKAPLVVQKNVDDDDDDDDEAPPPLPAPPQESPRKNVTDADPRDEDEAPSPLVTRVASAAKAASKSNEDLKLKLSGKNSSSSNANNKSGSLPQSTAGSQGPSAPGTPNMSKSPRLGRPVAKILSSDGSTRCAKCNTAISREATFCKHCGSSLKQAEVALCGGCNLPLRAGMPKCESCGWVAGASSSPTPVDRSASLTTTPPPPGRKSSNPVAPRIGIQSVASTSGSWTSALPKSPRGRTSGTLTPPPSNKSTSSTEAASTDRSYPQSPQRFSSRSQTSPNLAANPVSPRQLDIRTSQKAIRGSNEVAIPTSSIDRKSNMKSPSAQGDEGKKSGRAMSPAPSQADAPAEGKRSGRTASPAPSPQPTSPRQLAGLVEGGKKITRVIMAGSGSSTGTPNLGCLANRRCKACVDALQPNSKNRRRNPSLLIQHNGVNILIDCGKSFRESWINMVEQYGVKEIHAIIISHAHADSFLGLDDVREVVGHNPSTPLPVYATEKDLAVISATFPYLWDPRKATGSGYVSQLVFKPLPSSGPFVVGGLKFRAIPMPHGPDSTCLGFQFGPVVYMSDVSSVPDKLLEFLMALPLLRVLIIDALRIKDTNPAHLNLPQALAVVQQVRPERAFLTGCSHEFFYADVRRVLKKVCAKEQISVKIGYDGLSFSVNSEEF